MKHNGRIAYETIVAAKEGDSEAMEEILRHYSRYIAHFAKRTLYDEYGNHYDFVDEEIKTNIEADLAAAIVFDYDTHRLPKGETLEQ